MRIGEAFPSKYLKASDIPSAQFVPLMIDRVETEDVGSEGSPEHKPVMYFVGKEKGIVLNKTNAEMVAAAYGDETDDWHGKRVSIYSTTTSYQGKNVPCLRLAIPKAPVTKPVAPVMQRPPQQAPDPFVEEIAGQEIEPDSIPF